MDRLLVLRLETLGCSAEAWLNGVPLLRATGTQAAVSLPVHEFTQVGSNALELVIQPGPPTAPAAREPLLCNGQIGASLRLLLPRTGSVAHPASARTLAQIEWAPAADVLVDVPLNLRDKVELNIAFPRWRWLDAPVIADGPSLARDITAYVLDIAVGLTQGNPEPLIQASRLRLEELALAYQTSLADDVARLRAHIVQLHAAQALKPVLPSAETLLLRRVADGRLIDCLAADGTPFLQSPVVGGGRATWPLRLAAVDGRFYALR